MPTELLLMYFECVNNQGGQSNYLDQRAQGNNVLSRQGFICLRCGAIDLQRSGYFIRLNNLYSFLSSSIAAANKYLALADTKLPGKKADQMFVGLAINGRGSDANFKSIAMQANKFVLAGFGLQMAEKQ